MNACIKLMYLVYVSIEVVEVFKKKLYTKYFEFKIIKYN